MESVQDTNMGFLYAYPGAPVRFGLHVYADIV